MKTKTIALLCLPLLAPMAAMAQTGSNITLYGKLDVAYDMTRFSGVPARAASSANYVSNDISFWGLRGSEDLGGGTRAYFKLESGFAPDTGAATGGTQLFDREAYVGYGAQWGAIQLGSQYSPSLFVQLRSDAFGRNQNGSNTTLTQQSPSNLRGFLGHIPQNNAIQYVSPNLSGFSVRLLHGVSERAAAPKDLGQLTAIAVEYMQGPWYVGASYEQQVVAGATAASTLDNRTTGLGVAYDFKVVKLFGYLMHNELTNARDVNSYVAGVQYPIGAGVIKAMHGRRKIDNTAGGTVHNTAIGYFHALSRRTEVYTSLAYLDNGTATAFGIWPSTKSYAVPVAAGGPGLPSPGQNIRSLEIGIRHTF